MKRRIAGLGALMVVAPLAAAQSVWVERLPGEALPVTSPADRVRGEPGRMQVLETGCSSQPMAGVRQRIVDIALQEWAYFGFSVADETLGRGASGDGSRSGGGPGGGDDALAGGDGFGGDGFGGGGGRRFPRGFTWLDPEQSARLAQSIAGYWAITGDGSWILSRQNEAWTSSGVGTRWRDPWSAAFISWVMCESGLGEDSRFDRAINHHTYIDQAIRARDGASAEAAYFAFDIGEQAIEPGDLLCAARRPTYSSLSERRSQLGDGIRSHCDIVIKLEPENGRVLAVGGNVRGSVSLKLLPAEIRAGDDGTAQIRSVGRGRGQIFAHLKLRAEPVANDPIRSSPTLKTIGGQPELLDRVRSTLDRAVTALSRSILL